MNKMESATQFLTRHLNQFRCPVCKQHFNALKSGTLGCGSGHTFDLSKKGTLFFLNAPVNTEYTAAMLSHRQRVLQAGFFKPMLEVVQALVNPGLILDAGSGEGTTTKWLAQHRVESDFVGLDISKPAINIAGSGLMAETQPLFAVGDLARLPFGPDSLNSIVNILSPANYYEFDRVLVSGGRLIKVIPNSQYLTELRGLVYPKGDHATYNNYSVKAHFSKRYPKAEWSTVQYQFDLTPTLFASLFEMTPLTWQAGHRREKILQQGLERITADFEIAVVAMD